MGFDKNIEVVMLDNTSRLHRLFNWLFFKKSYQSPEEVPCDRYQADEALRNQDNTKVDKDPSYKNDAKANAIYLNLLNATLEKDNDENYRINSK